MLATEQMLQLPNAIVRRGGKLKLVDGWANRGANGLPMAAKIKGSMQHWIVSNFKPGVDRQTLGLVTNGHSTLQGPLANLHLDFDGDITLVAGGRANHGGVGSWNGVSGNQFWIATEAEGPPFTPEQIQAYAIIVCAVADVTGQHPRDWSPSHMEYAPTRKVDVGTYIVEIRSRAIQMYEGKTPPPVIEPTPEQKEEYDMFLIFDSRYGSFWVIPSDLSQKVYLHPDDRKAIEAGWKNQDVKWFGPASFTAATLDRIPDNSGSRPVKIEGTVVSDLVGDGLGKV